MKSIRTSCDYCDSQYEQFISLFSVNSYNIVKCKNCGLVFTLEIPGNTELEEYYGKSYFEGDIYKSYSEQDAERKRYFLGQIMYFESFYNSYNGKILEMGSATGSFLDCARFLGYEGIGTEKSEYASQIANSKNLNVFKNDLPELVNHTLKKGSFDAVFMWDVIEHLNSPSSTLKYINYLTKPGGLLTLNTLNISSPTVKFLKEKWSQFLPPAHLFYFSLKTINNYLTKFGYDIIKLKTSGPLFYDDLTNKYYILKNLFSNKFIQRITDKLKLGYSQFLIAKKTREV